MGPANLIRAGQSGTIADFKVTTFNNFGHSVALLRPLGVPFFAIPGAFFF
jgi:hypothetical protein